jgi:hypothetical protein
MFDGEGYVGKSNCRNRSLRYRVTIYNNHRGCLEQIQKFLTSLEIRSAIYTKKHKNPKHKTSYYIQLSDAESATKFLEAVKQISIIKAPKIDAAIKWCKFARKLIRHKREKLKAASSLIDSGFTYWETTKRTGIPHSTIWNYRVKHQSLSK